MAADKDLAGLESAETDDRPTHPLDSFTLAPRIKFGKHDCFFFNI
jgi:hypothetical protein